MIPTLEPELEADLIKVQEFFKRCMDIFVERGTKYGFSWKVLKTKSIANLIEMKANRAVEMGDENAKSLDETTDIANYAAMLYIKLSEKDL